jgi:hypothetical protein
VAAFWHASSDQDNLREANESVREAMRDSQFGMLTRLGEKLDQVKAISGLCSLWAFVGGCVGALPGSVVCCSRSSFLCFSLTLFGRA